MRILTLILCLALPVSAQFGRKTIPVADEKITSAQAGDFFRAIREVTSKSGEVVFTVYSLRQPVASAISVGDDILLAKLSELAGKPRLLLLSPKNEALSVKILGAYPEHDLAVIYAKGLNAPAAKLIDGSGLAEGSLLAAVRSDGEAQGIGVKSVAARSLRNKDQGFLGVSLNMEDDGTGVIVRDVPRQTAAEEAGVRGGDRILSVNGVEVNGFYELSTLLKRLRVGDEPEIVIVRGQKTLTVQPTLRGNPAKDRESRRLKMMDTFSGGRSGVHDGFPNVMQSDMELSVNSTGMPVVNLKGEIIGMVIARAGRISTLILPSELILEVLKKKPLTNSEDAQREMVDTQLSKLQKRFAQVEK